jgi:integrase
MTDTTTVPSAGEPSRRKAARTSASKLRGGVMKRGNTWSYVIRVLDAATGVSKPRWVGGFEINRSALIVADYLAEWVDAHAPAVKPKTLAGYRHDIDHYIVPASGECGSRPCARP